MGSAHATHAPVDQATLDAIEKKTVKKYINVFWALCVFTVFEVGIVFFEKMLSKLVIDSVVILFTLLKAGFVGYYFMHLEYEKAWTKIVAVLPLLIIGFYAVFLMPDSIHDRGRVISLYVGEPARALPVPHADEGHGVAEVAKPVEGTFFQVRSASNEVGDATTMPAGNSALPPSTTGGAAAPAAGGGSGSDNPLDSVEAWR